MMDNKLPEPSNHTKPAALEEIKADSQSTEITKADPLHSTVLSCSTVMVDLSPGSAEGSTRRERFKSDLQQASQEITILVTNHESPEKEMEEAEWSAEGGISPESMVPSEEDNLDVSMVVADLIELSQIQQTCLFGNSPAEISTNSEEHIEECRESHKEQTQTKDQHKPTDSTDGVISSESKDPMRSQKAVSNVSLKQVKSSHRDMLPRQQQHIQTQSSLEVVYHSAATSPMTPPEGSTAFFFPYSFNKLGKSEGNDLFPVETKDAELQGSVQVEYRSVATAPMTPISTNAPELPVGTCSVATSPMTPLATNAPKILVETRSVATAPMTPLATTAPELLVETRSVATAPMTPLTTTAPELQVETRTIATAPMTPIATVAPGLFVETRSVATAPMTPTANNAPELWVETRNVATAPMTPIATVALQTWSVATAPMTPMTTTAPELMVETHSVATAPMTPLSTVAPGLKIATCSVATAPMTPLAKTAPELYLGTCSVSTGSITPIKTTAPELQVETHSVAIAPMTPVAKSVPKSLIRTCSVATSPMTPVSTTAPELQIETRSVATAPMTPIATRAPELHVETRSVATAPMTPIATRAPDFRIETRSIATSPMTPVATRAPELSVTTHSIAKVRRSSIILGSSELIPEPEPRAMFGSGEPPEPVQEVCWDEKGMTWEVYGAVVEVSVLGSAIQKHLEKQVLKKQIKLPDAMSSQTLPPKTTDTSTTIPSSPPALSVSSRHSSAKGSRKRDRMKGTIGRQRRNPIHSFVRNCRRQNCCSRVHSE